MRFEILILRRDYQIEAMANSFIPGSSDHLEPSVEGPSFDSRPVFPLVLAISPPIATVAPFQSIIPSLDARLPIRESPTC